MQKYINEYGKEWYSGVTDDSPFSSDLFYQVPETSYGWDEPDHQWALHTNIGSLTVVDRMTGFGYRDIETGFRDKNGAFWLASCGIDVRESGVKTIGEAIAWVKARANNCIPERDNPDSLKAAD